MNNRQSEVTSMYLSRINRKATRDIYTFLIVFVVALVLVNSI